MPPTIPAVLGLLLLVLAPQATESAAPGQEPPQEGEQPVEAPPEEPGPRPLTRERLVRTLEKIGEGAQRLEELAESDESRGLAERIRWLSENLVRELEAPPPPPDVAADGSGPVPKGPWVDPTKVGARGALSPRSRPNGFNLVDDGLLTARNLALSNGDGNAVTMTHYSGTGGKPVRWFNVEVAALPHPGTGRDMIKWGTIGYDARDWVFERCTFKDVKVEHGQYLSCLGGLRWSQCLFSNIGSQGLQLVGAVPGSKREAQTALRGNAWWATVNRARDEWVEVLECAFLEVGQPSGARPSFAFSGFDGPPNPVRIARSVFRTTGSQHPDTGGVVRDCYGAVMAHNRRRVELLDTYIEYRNGDRDVVQLWYNSDGVEGTPDVVIRGCTILSDSQRVDIRVAPGDTVVLEGNSGTAQVLISSNPKYVWPTMSEWDRSKVIYQGPIGVDYGVE